MLDFIIAPENLPFSVALLVMLMIGAVEALGLGASAAHLDLDVDADAGGLLDWLGVGEVPLLILLVVFLALFGMAGIAVQQVADGLLGDPLSLWLATPAAFVLALPLTSICARGLGRIMPKDETTAISLDSLVGHRGVVTIGTARRGSPAQVRIVDMHGQPHHVMVEPHDEAHPFAEGDTVLLARREGHIFIGLGEADGITPHAHTRPSITSR